MKRPVLSRRTALRGLGGACLALPWLASMGCDTEAGPRPRFRSSGPKRFVVFWTPNGTLMEHWRPTGSQNSFKLSPILAPLEPHKPDILVVDGVDALSAYKGPGDAHQKGIGQSLTCTELQEGNFPGDGVGGFTSGWADGISVDQRVADAIGGGPRFRSLEFGVGVEGATVFSRISYRGPGQPIPPENDPQAAFTRIFGDLVVDPKLQARKNAERHVVLDAVAADYEKLLPKLGADDRLRLAAHLAAVRDLEMRLDSDAVASGACQKPELGDIPDPWAIASIPEVGRLQMDLLAMALACDLTRVGSIMWTNSASKKPFPWLGIPEGHHELAHRGDEDQDAQAKLVKINTWYAQQFAYLIAKLKAIPEGDGSVLDSTLLVWANEHSRGNNHSRYEMPYVVAGKAGGAVLPGRWLQLAGDVPHNNFWLGCMQAMGLDDTSFGNPEYCTGSVNLG